MVELKPPVARHRAPQGSPPAPARPRSRPSTDRRVRPSGLGVAVLAIGLVITALLSLACYVVNNRNEGRLLRLQTRQTGAVLQALLPTIQTPMASAAEIAATSNGAAAPFRDYMTAYVGKDGPFVSATLWELRGGRPTAMATVGVPSLLAQSPDRNAAFLSSAQGRTAVSLAGPLAGPRYRLGYAFPSSGAAASYVVYAEGQLPPNRRATIQRGSPFGNLRFALYLGRSPKADRLLETNIDHPPVRGRTATAVVPFGAGALTLVASSTTQLGGSISGALWWIVAIAGLLVTIAAAWTAERLVRRRRAAERLTGEVRTLLGEQRTIAETLQHALLPKELPDVPGMQLTARYVPGASGVDIGGDWYDVVPLDEQRFFFAVGDVSGRGVAAGSVMASLLFAIRGFVSEGHQPAEVLNALTRLLDVQRDQHFATLLCGVADVARHEVTIANAGHLPPLLVSGERTEFVAAPTGPPIGVPVAPPYSATTIPIPAGATLLAYTDGLIERRAETLDDGLRRLYDTAVAADLGGEALIDRLMSTLAPEGCDDDTAILGLQWRK